MKKLVVVLALLVCCPTAQAARLRAGAGQADITPPKTGYFLGGWTRSDRLALGQSTRLFANTLVLQRGHKKVALVAAELFGIPAGMQQDIAAKVADLGFDKTSVLLAASHTHSAPGGFTNNPTYNTSAPALTGAQALTLQNVNQIGAFLFNPAPADPQLYTFLVDQIAASIRRADADRGPAAAAWGHTTLTGLTQNRSLFAYLRNFGIDVPDGQATVAMDPKGPNDPIDANVDVLRVDKLIHGRHVPIGAYSNFADHGTVVHSETQAYSGDHHAAAWRVFVRKVRKRAHVPQRQMVVNVYPNGAEGDQTAGIQHVGIAAARFVGTTEANAMFRAWRSAGKHLSRKPALDWRWTRTCFCGRETATGPVDSAGLEGLPFVTGSDEGRGPLYDVTGQSLEGTTSPNDDPVQGDKVGLPVGHPPAAVPIGVYRIGNGVIATIPGEPTKEVGVDLRKAVLGAMAGSGVTHAVIGGLALDYIQYVTTPAEYGAQSYEGASTLYGKNEATFFEERIAELGKALAGHTAAPKPYDLDPSYGVHADGPAYPAGAANGSITEQPAATVARGSTAHLAWSGGPDGEDRPVDRAFILAQRKVGKRWRTVDTDLGLHTLWRVDADGHYTLEWDVLPKAATGQYRFRVTASRYALTSAPFAVTG